MTQQIVPFTPSDTANFEFQVTLDGAPYNCICTFNAYRSAYYVSVYDLVGELIVSRPVVASPSFFNVNLLAGYFETTMIYRDASQSFEIPGLPAVPFPPRIPQPAPTPIDPYFGNVVLLLHFNGDNGAQVFSDSSNRKHIPVFVQNVGETQTDVVLFGVASGFFNGGYIWYDPDPDWAMGSGPFTVECQVRFSTTGIGKRNLFLGQADSIGGNHCFGISKTDTDYLSCTVTTADGEFSITGTTKMIANQWYACALERTDTSLILFMNGAIQGEISITGTIPVETSHFGIAIGGDYVNTNPPAFGTLLLGYVDEFRLTKGIARYAGGYTPQIAPFPDF